jgi:Phage tail fibre repeat
VVDATTAVAGIVRLSTATNSTSTTEAATPSAVKAAVDNANSRVPVTRSVSAGGIATGGGTLAGDLIINVIDATQAEAEAGLIQTRAMTPLRVAQAIAARIAAGTLQAGSALLTSFSVPRGNGIIVQLGAQTIGTRAVIGGAGIDVTNGDGVAGNPTVAVNAAALAATTLGNGHVWGNFTASRAINAVYQNTTGRPIMVSIDLTGGNTTGDLAVSVDNVTWLTVCNRSLDGNAEWFSTIVPQGNYYRLTGNITISTWAELR